MQESKLSSNNCLLFYLNGKRIEEQNPQPELTLIEYLRSTKVGLTGCKLGCGEGGCGACTVMVSHFDTEKNKIVHRAVNACLAPLCSIEGCHVITVEGIGNSRDGLHPIQQRMIDFHGSQCGYCTPGIVMALYSYLRTHPKATKQEMEESMDGNLCRCTGYRPILDAAKTFAVDNSEMCGLGEACCRFKAKKNQPKDEEKSTGSCDENTVSKVDDCTYPQNTKPTKTVENCSCRDNSSLPSYFQWISSSPRELIFPPALMKHQIRSLFFQNEKVSWYRPVSLLELLSLKQRYPQAKLIVGNTEIGVDVRFRNMSFPIRIATTHIPEFNRITIASKTMSSTVWGDGLGTDGSGRKESKEGPSIEMEGMLIGPSVTLTTLKEYLLELKQSKQIKPHQMFTCDSLLYQLRYFSSNQIRNVCCIGGNIITASPISDLNPVLQAVRTILTFSHLSETASTSSPSSSQPSSTSDIATSHVVTRDICILDFFLDYRKVAMNEKEVLTSIFIPFSRPFEYVQAYKQSRRRDDDIAIVASGMRVHLQPFFTPCKDKKNENDKNNNKTGNENNQTSEVVLSWRVLSCTLSFGGMNKITCYAKKTQQFLMGQEWKEDVIYEAYNYLAQDLPLAPQSPGGQIEYRRSLANSFLFKFFIQVCLELEKAVENGALENYNDNTNQEQKRMVYTTSPSIPQNYHSAVLPFHRPVSCGRQEYQVPVSSSSDEKEKDSKEDKSESKERKNVVGEPLAHVSGVGHVTGSAIYIDDIPSPPHTLYVGLVISEKPHAKIISVDPSAALRCEGVVDYIDSKDVPGSNMIGEMAFDEELFATKSVPCVGQIIGAIVAESAAQAKYAARQVKVQYEDLAAVLTIEDAIQAKSFLTDVQFIECGDLKQGFQESEHVLQGEMRIGGQEHFYLETHASLVLPNENEFTVFSSTQNPAKHQEYVASVLGMKSHKIICRVKRMGGGFGGKETRSMNYCCVAAVAAHKLRRPVRISLERDMDMCISGQRHPFYGKYKVGFTSKGNLKALELDIYSNGGCTMDLSLPVLHRALFHVDNAYKIPNLKVTGRVCKTNLPSNTAFRGFGGPQGMMINEVIMDHISRTLRIEPCILRQLNFYRESDTTHYGQKLTNVNLQKCWEQLKINSKYEEKKAKVIEFNRSNKFRKQGIAMIPTKFGVTFTAKFMNQGGALVHVYSDGSVLVTHGGTEMGQGLHTKMIQIAADAFGISVNDVQVSETSTDKVPNTSPTAASMSSDINGMAVLDACNQINNRLAEFKQQLLKTDSKKYEHISWKELIHNAYMERINLSAQGFHKVPKIGYNFATHQGQPFAYFSYGTCCSLVEIDTLTGDSHILSTDIVMDVGKSINPAIDVGQIEGAFVQGVGWCTMEELIWGDSQHKWVRTGQLMTRGPGFYKLPGFNDVPIEFNISLLKNSPNPLAIHSSKAIGEPPLFLSASVFFAIKDAIGYARSENGIGDGYFLMNSPATSERIRMACADKQTAPFVSNPQTYQPLGSW